MKGRCSLSAVSSSCYISARNPKLCVKDSKVVEKRRMKSLRTRGEILNDSAFIDDKYKESQKNSTKYSNTREELSVIDLG